MRYLRQVRPTTQVYREQIAIYVVALPARQIVRLDEVVVAEYQRIGDRVGVEPGALQPHQKLQAEYPPRWVPSPRLWVLSRSCIRTGIRLHLGYGSPRLRPETAGQTTDQW